MLSRVEVVVPSDLSIAQSCILSIKAVPEDSVADKLHAIATELVQERGAQQVFVLHSSKFSSSNS